MNLTPQDLIILQTYGPWFLSLILVLRELLPFLKDRLFPAFIKKRESDEAKRDAFELRQLEVMEKLSEAALQGAVMFALVDERTKVMAQDLSYIRDVLVANDARSVEREQKTQPIHQIIPPQSKKRAAGNG